MEVDTGTTIHEINTTSPARGNRQISYLATTAVYPDPRNPRLHTKVQLQSIAKSIETFGFNAPILVDANRKIVAGHGRHEAAKYLDLTQVPVIFLDHLTETQARAYMLADNKLTLSFQAIRTTREAKAAEAALRKPEY